MKTINRDKIQRMIGNRPGGGGSGGNVDLTGMASQMWVDGNYVSKEFFARLFTVHGLDENDNEIEVEPNDLDSEITSIQSMVGHWTEEYLSALGIGSGGGGGGSVLTEPLASINESGIGLPLSADQVIVWNGSAWAYRPYTTGSGTVTSIRITVPTGFTVNPSQAITTAGTFVIGFDTGYSLPTTDKQGQWDNAYSWVNTNAASTVSKTAWGRTYWNAGVPQNISGNIESTGHITPETGGYYEIGTEPSSNGAGLRYKAIHVEEVWINGIKVTADANGVHVVNNGLYADTHVSALGAGSGGGGGASLTEPLASINTSGMGSPLSSNQVIVWNGSSWTYMPYTTGSGTVTSIKITVPTGFTVNPSQAITSSGTFVIGFDTGYSLPTTDKQGQWDNAYSWVNTNAASTVSKTAWGRTYWNAGVPQNINGNIESTGHITPETGGFYEIGTEPSGNNQGLRYKAIHVEEVWINGVKVTADANGVHVVNNGLYADTHVSALGAGSGGGGGSTGITIEDVWTAMASTAPNSSSQQIHVSHLAQALSGYATTSSVNSAVNTAVSSVTKWLTIRNGDGTVVYGTYNGQTAATIDIPSGGSYILPAATSNALGGIKIGYTESGKNYAVQLSNEKAYVYVPWENDDTKNTVGNFNIGASTGALYSIYLVGVKVSSNSDGSYYASCVNKYCYIDTSNKINAAGFVVAGGTSSQFIKADGSLDSSSYITSVTSTMVTNALGFTPANSSALSDYLLKTGGTLTGDIGVKKADSSIWVSAADGTKKVGLNSDNNRGVYDYTGSKWLIGNNGTSTFLMFGNVGIGTTNPTTTLHVEGSEYIKTSLSIAGIDQSGKKLYVNGDSNITGSLTVGGTLTVASGFVISDHAYESSSKPAAFSLSSGGNKSIVINTGTAFPYMTNSWQMWSDIRKKDVLNNIELNVEDIANAPLFNFKWKGEEGSAISIGTSAQYWEKRLPTAVSIAPDGFLAMDYTGTAYASVVTVARKVVNHEKEIERLKKRIEDLEKQLSS